MLVVGGDGTIGWILSVLDGLQQQFAAQPDPMHWTLPPVAVLPLGTGAVLPNLRQSSHVSPPTSLLHTFPPFGTERVPAGGAAACGNAFPLGRWNGMTLGRHARCDNLPFSSLSRKACIPGCQQFSTPERRRVGVLASHKRHPSPDTQGV